MRPHEIRVIRFQQIGDKLQETESWLGERGFVKGQSWDWYRRVFVPGRGVWARGIIVKDGRLLALLRLSQPWFYYTEELLNDKTC